MLVKDGTGMRVQRGQKRDKCSVVSKLSRIGLRKSMLTNAKSGRERERKTGAGGEKKLRSYSFRITHQKRGHTHEEEISRQDEKE